MDFRRAFGRFVILASWLASCGSLWATDDTPRYTLRRPRAAGEQTRVEVALQVGGNVKLVTDGKSKDVPMSVLANLKYDEQLIAVDPSGRPSRALRAYDQARAAISIDKGNQKPALDRAHRLIAVEKPEKSAILLYCPSAALSREELDLIDVPGNTLVLDQMLPAGELAVGERWKLADETLAALLGLDGVSWSDAQSVLGKVEDGVAEISSAGSVSGAIGGVSTEIELKAKYKVDVKTGRMRYFALLIKEKRVVGHVGPGLDTVAKLIIQLSPISGSRTLTSATARQALATAFSPEMAQLAYVSPGGLFRFDHDRRWYLTSDDAKLTVLRLLDRGELVAQCNVSALHHDAKKSLSLAEFQNDVRESLGKNFGQFVNASQNTSEAGYTVYRVVVHGTVSQLPIEWIYYLIEDRTGQRVSLAFTLEDELRDRFAQADRALVSEIRLTEAAAATAKRPAKKP